MLNSINAELIDRSRIEMAIMIMIIRPHTLGLVPCSNGILTFLDK